MTVNGAEAARIRLLVHQIHYYRQRPSTCTFPESDSPSKRARLEWPITTIIAEAAVKAPATNGGLHHCQLPAPEPAARPLTDRATVPTSEAEPPFQPARQVMSQVTLPSSLLPPFFVLNLLLGALIADIYLFACSLRS